ncbi:MAG: 3'-5' exonuclease [Bryobacteraceae bacterium]|nr:3'-5' exonuclease [Bryobacteraceae bacterium]
MIERYLSAFEDTWAGDTPAESVRFVVLDSETTGLDPKRDKLISIGAVAVECGEIRLEDSFEVLLRVAYNNSSVTVHGITRDEASAGFSEREGVEMFLDYLRDGIIVGHHIGHDLEALSCAMERHWGERMRNRSLDTMDLTLHLERDGAFAGREMAQGFSLDGLCEMFGVAPHDRHTAGGDAFITAQIFLRLLRAAKRVGRTTVEQLSERFVEG